MYIRYRALSNSSHVNNSAFTFSQRTRLNQFSVHVVVQLLTSVPVQTSFQVQISDHVFISHVHIVFHELLSDQVQTSVQVPINVDKYSSALSSSIFVSPDIR